MDFASDGIAIEDRKRALETIMDSYGDEILQLSYSYVRDKAIAEDLTQEIFVKCYKSLHTYKKNSKLRTWLWRIAINHCKDYLKSWYFQKVQLTKDNSHPIATGKQEVEQAILKKDEEESLIDAVFNLPVNYKEVIYLFYFEERCIKEISQLIEVKEATIKTRLRRGKELLKVLLEEG
ncbi:sigma-70 family RNA polymerase sigma factor [Alkalihalobacillus sp. AL-G]|nr:sigma-70 family RNA polymerase sigma factor [Alkalihalobacillus sp. AL-G]WLD95404.1 sigma-70 family RNA polymerase sigma factor [Alkalihalobacillus sp. AL-G]